MEPPVITISDPNQPDDEPGDVLHSGDERDPWRPSPRLVKLVLAVIVIVAVVTVPVVLVQKHQDRVSKDKQALSQLKLSAPRDGDFSGDLSAGEDPQATLTVANDGPTAVTALWLRIDRTGYPQVDLKKDRLPAGQNTSLMFDVARSAVCPKTLGLSTPSGVFLHVRTARGNETTVRLPVRDTSFAFEYQEDLEQACHLGPASDDVEVVTRPTTVHGRSLTVPLSLLNSSTDTIDVQAVMATAGFAATSPSVPGVLTPTGAAGGNSQTDLVVTVTLTDCVRAREVFPKGGTNVVELGSNLSFTVAKAGGLDSSTLDTDDETFRTALAGLVRRYC